jgi:hypothetical protein
MNTGYKATATVDKIERLLLFIKHNISSQNKMNLLIICVLISTVVSHEIFTRVQLRGLYQEQLNKGLNTEIQTIIQNVITSAQGDKTSYTYGYNLGRSILGKFEDATVIKHLQNILVDSNITMVGPKCCSSNWCSGEFATCKYITVEW